jgi:hypothetical protein
LNSRQWLGGGDRTTTACARRWRVCEVCTGAERGEVDLGFDFIGLRGRENDGRAERPSIATGRWRHQNGFQGDLD